MPTREWSPLTTNWAVTSDSSPRTSDVDSIGEHHAATTSRDLCIALFQPGGRTVSPNYLVHRREIWGIVPENRRAWTSSDAWADSRSITKEIVNDSPGPEYGFHPETLDTIMRLDRDIALFYGIPFRHSIPGFWEHRNLAEWYGRSYPTACAGPSFRINDIIAGAATAPAPPIDYALLRRQKGDTMYLRGKSAPTVIYNVYTDANGKARLRVCGKNEAAGAIEGGLVVGFDDATLVALGQECGYVFQQPNPLPVVVLADDKPAA